MTDFLRWSDQEAHLWALHTLGTGIAAVRDPRRRHRRDETNEAPLDASVEAPPPAPVTRLEFTKMTEARRHVSRAATEYALAKVGASVAEAGASSLPLPSASRLRDEVIAAARRELKIPDDQALDAATVEALHRLADTLAVVPTRIG